MIPERWRAQVDEWVADVRSAGHEGDIALEVVGPVVSADGETTLHEARILLPFGGEPDVSVWVEGINGTVSGILSSPKGKRDE